MQYITASKSNYVEVVYEQIEVSRLGSDDGQTKYIYTDLEERGKLAEDIIHGKEGDISSFTITRRRKALDDGQLITWPVEIIADVHVKLPLISTVDLELGLTGNLGLPSNASEEVVTYRKSIIVSAINRARAA